MCTAVFDKPNGLFGRTLDLEYSYRETVTVTPRGFAFSPRIEAPFSTQYTIIGIATVENGYPLYYDAMNEHGLCMAGLNFPRSARYTEPSSDSLNLAPFELIPYILGTCRNLNEAEDVLAQLRVCDISFSEAFPVTSLHWMIADRTHAVVAESTKDGLRVYPNDIGVMANEPPFPFHQTYLENFAALSANESGTAYSRGLSAYGLPGDFSSSSRFVRAAFLLKNSVTQGFAPTQFFKILDNVSVPRGAIQLTNGKTVITHYASCMDMTNGVYYYKTYDNSRVHGVRLQVEKTDTLRCFPLQKEDEIVME